jgi:hypothetical protein
MTWLPKSDGYGGWLAAELNLREFFSAYQPKASFFTETFNFWPQLD